MCHGFQVISALLQQYKDTDAPAQKRIAAYLMLMRNPDVVEEVLKTLKDEKDLQVKSFVVSHITNLLDTEDPNLKKYVYYIIFSSHSFYIQKGTTFIRIFSKMFSFKFSLIFQVFGRSCCKNYNFSMAKFIYLRKS